MLEQHAFPALMELICTHLHVFHLVQPDTSILFLNAPHAIAHANLVASVRITVHLAHFNLIFSIISA